MQNTNILKDYATSSQVHIHLSDIAILEVLGIFQVGGGGGGGGGSIADSCPPPPAGAHACIAVLGILQSYNIFDLVSS